MTDIADFRISEVAVVQSSLVVTDLKLGSAQRGGVGFSIESGTVGYFSNLRIAYSTR